jgi:hypothetical protein
MIKIQNYIDTNLNEFLQLSDSEVIHMSSNEFDNDIVEYLKHNYRYDYKDICVYYVSDRDEVCVENMSY